MNITKITNSRKFYYFCGVLFAINTYPLFAEWMMLISARRGNMWSWWSLVAFIYIFIMMHVDIFSFSHPPPEKDQERFKKWKEKLWELLGINNQPMISLIGMIKQVIAYIKNLAIVQQITSLKALIYSLGYFGIAATTWVPGLGRIAHLIYAKNKIHLRWGLILIYIGGLIRFYLAYLGIEILNDLFSKLWNLLLN